MLIISSVELNCDIKYLNFSIYTWVSFNTVLINNNIVFILEKTVFNVLQTFQTD